MTGLLFLAFTAVLTDPLEWKFPDSAVAETAEFCEIDVPRDGRISVDILFNGLKAGERVELSASVDGGEWSEFLSVPVEQNTGDRIFTERDGYRNPYVTRRAPFRVYDALKPLGKAEFTPTGKVACVRFAIEAERQDAVWPFIDFTFKHDGGTVSRPLKVMIHGVRSEADGFFYTNWMSFDNIAERHGLEPWSEPHYAMIERYVALAAKNRQNSIWLDLSTVFDRDEAGEPTILATNRCERLMAIADRCGIRYFEGPHLCGRDGGWQATNLCVRAPWVRVSTPEGTLAMQRLCTQLYDFILAHDLKDRWYQHCHDEVQPAAIGDYYFACSLIRRYMPGIRIMDAIGTPDFSPAVDVICPNVRRWVERRDEFEYFRTNCGQTVWCYTCCSPGGKLMNRLLDNQLIQPALIFPVSESLGFKGFLHWGYNHWQERQNPFETSCITNWGGNAKDTLPAGDTHVVYPGEDGPWPSARLEATRTGMEDVGLFRALKASDGAKAAELQRRLGRDFGDFERDVRRYREVRRELLIALDGAVKVSSVTFTKPQLRWLWGGFGFHNAEASMTKMMTPEFRNERVLKTFAEIMPTYARVFAGFADWSKPAMDAFADYYDSTFRKAGTCLYLVPGRFPTIMDDFDAEDYAERVAVNLEYLVKTRGCTNIRYYCAANELSCGNEYAWFWRSGNMEVFKDIHTELYKAFRRHGLDIGLMASDASHPSLMKTVDWAMENMDDTTDTYCWHYYHYGCNPDGSDVYPAYYTNLVRLVSAANRREKRLSLGEFGCAAENFKSPVMRDDVGLNFRASGEGEAAALAAMTRAEIALAALNAGCVSAVSWTFCDYPDPFFDREVARVSGHGTEIRYNKWGLFRWDDERQDYSAYPDLYTMGHLVRLFRRGARVLPWKTTDEELRVGAVTNPDGSTAVALINRGAAKRVELTLPSEPRQGLRVYEFDAAAAPENRFNDLQPATATLAPDGCAATVEMKAKSMVILTDDYIVRTPGEVRGVAIERGKLVWDDIHEDEHAYYRVYKNGEQIASTVANYCVIDDFDAEYTVKSVDRWGNSR